jgi:hypothetical protein
MKWLTLILVLLVIAPALIDRGGEMRAEQRGRARMVLASVGAIRLGVRVEWRVSL